MPVVAAMVRRMEQGEPPITTRGVRAEGAAGGIPAFRILQYGYRPEGMEWYFPGVRSPFWRIYYNDVPGWFVRHEGKEYPLAPDRLLLIAEDTLFDCVGGPGIPHLWMHFKPPPGSPVKLATPHAVPLDHRLRGVMEESLEAHKASASVRRDHAAAAWLHMTFGRIEQPPIREFPPRLEEVLRFVEGNLAGDLSNERLSRLAAMSQSTFIRWFGGLTGETPAAWVQRARVKQAAQLLALSGSSIEQIASDCGFPNRYYFSRVFRQHQGCGPAEYRKRQVR